MDTHGQTYGDLIILGPGDDSQVETIHRIPLGASTAIGGIDETWLQDLFFRIPEILPVAAIDAAYRGALPVCRELSTPAGRVDAVYVNPLGRLILAEFKLWRNPQARREVIGQILDYAQAIASWSYEDLQREVSKALKRRGNVLFELIHANTPDIDEAEFVDNVTRHLRRGEFLLLIIGDGIHEGVENIVNFVQRHSGLHFNLALVEAALYRDREERVIVQPRVLARTEIVRRIVVEAGVSRDAIPSAEQEHQDVLSDRQRENRRFWTAVLKQYSFSDVTVDIPEITKDPSLFVTVRNSGVGDGGLWFSGYLNRSPPHLGCYLSCRKGVPLAVRTYEEIERSLEELRRELRVDLISWKNSTGRPRIGFRRDGRFPLVSDGDEFNDFDLAVEWMRDHLDLLVSALHPRLQRLLSAEN